MHRTTRWIGVLSIVVATGLPLASCASVPSSTHKTVDPVKIETVGDVKHMTLTDKAVERLAIGTAPVTEVRVNQGTDAGTVRLLMPYSALLYMPDGKTFAYTNPDGHTYVREFVGVESIRGDQVVLTSGPKVGTKVVTAGGTELWGTEFGVK
jgi:multidrug efflux pump subunit AcrA (membrane-fusion protein)